MWSCAAVLILLLYIVFALAERKNDIQKKVSTTAHDHIQAPPNAWHCQDGRGQRFSLWQIGTFCAAAGKRAYDAGYRVSPMTIGYLGYPLPVRNADPPAS